MLAIQIIKEFQVRRIVVHGYSELVIKQMTGKYQARHPRRRIYRNVSQDLMECFEECKFNLIPILQNFLADSLATYDVVFNTPLHPNRKYEIQVRHELYVANNVKSWQVFEDDKQIQKFLAVTGEFDGLTIDEDNELLEEAAPTHETLQSHIVAPKEIP